MSSNSTFRPALLLMSGRAAAFTVTFLIPVFLSRIFTQEEFGTYKQIFLIVYTLFAVGQIGMSECLYYFLPTHSKEAGRFVINSIVVLAVAGLACFAGLVVAQDRVAAWLSNPGLTPYIWMAGAYLLLMLPGCALETVMIARKRYRWATFTYATSDLLRGALLILPAILTRSIEWMMIGALTFCALRLATLLLYVRSEFSSELIADWPLLKKQFAYTVPFALAVLVEIVQANYHQYAVAYYFDAAQFAIYSVGCLQIPLVDFMASPACNVMMVRMGEEIHEGRRNALLPIWHDTSRKLALVFLPLVALLVVNAYRLITLLFPPQYAASVPIFMIWSLTILFSIPQTDGVLRVLAQTRFLVLMNLTRLIAIVALMGWSLNTFGLAGAVLITIIGMTIAKTMALLRLKMLLDIPVRRLMPWMSLGGIAIVAMLAAIPSAIISAGLELSSLYVLPISGMVYMAVYVALLLTFGLLSEGEKRGMTDLVSRCLGVRARRAG